MDWQPLDYIGLLGGLLLLFAFWRTTSGVWKVTSPWYELDNFLAAGLLMYYSWQKHAYVNIFLNVIWGLVAVKGLSSYAERRLVRSQNYRRGYRKGRRTRQKL
jgi:hypothetical protein